MKVTNSTRQSASEHGKIRPGIVKSRGWHKNQIRRSFQVNQCLSPNSKFIGELNFVIHRWSKYLRQWKCYIFFTLLGGCPEMFSKNQAISQYWGFLQKNAFFAWLWPIESEMENKPSNCWLWLKAMMMKWKCTRTHLHKLSTELFAFSIPAISWNLISTQNATEDDLKSEYLTSFHISSISSQRSSLFRKMKLNCTALILIDNLHYFDVLCLCLQCILQAYRWRLCASACNLTSVMLRGDYMYALISQTHQRLNLLFTYCIFFTAWWLGW